MRVRPSPLALLALPATLVLSACTSTSVPQSLPPASGVPVASAEPRPPAALTDPAAVLVVEDQTSEGPTVRIKAVALSEPGHVVIVGDDGRNVLGSSLVEPGATASSIQVSLAEQPTKKIRLMARLYADTDGDGFFSAGDRPVTDGKPDDASGTFPGLQRTFDFTGAKVVNN